MPALGIALIFSWLAAKAGRDAARAAAESVRVSRNADRPHISVIEAKLIGMDDVAGTAWKGHGLSVYVRARNDGRSMAIIEAVSAGHTFDDNAAKLDAAELSQEWGPFDFALAPQEVFGDDLPSYYIPRFDGTEREDMLSAKRMLYVFGEIRYRDLHDVVRIAGFVFAHRLSPRRPADGEFTRSLRHRLWFNREETPQSKPDPMNLGPRRAARAAALLVQPLAAPPNKA